MEDNVANIGVRRPEMEMPLDDEETIEGARALLRAGPSAAANVLDARKRLMRDLRNLQQHPREGISAHPINDDLMHWKAVIFGPEGSSWEGGIFRLDLQFPMEYPMAPPAVKFLSPIFHPNVYRDGKICMDIMKSQWSPAYDIAALLLSIQSLLNDPNPGSAANGEAAEMFVSNRREYDQRVQDIVEQSLEYVDDDDDDDDDEEGSTLPGDQGDTEGGSAMGAAPAAADPPA